MKLKNLLLLLLVSITLLSCERASYFNENDIRGRITTVNSEGLIMEDLDGDRYTVCLSIKVKRTGENSSDSESKDICSNSFSIDRDGSYSTTASLEESSLDFAIFSDPEGYELVGRPYVTLRYSGVELARHSNIIMAELDGSNEHVFNFEIDPEEYRFLELVIKLKSLSLPDMKLGLGSRGVDHYLREFDFSTLSIKTMKKFRSIFGIYSPVYRKIALVKSGVNIDEALAEIQEEDERVRRAREAELYQAYIDRLKAEEKAIIKGNFHGRSLSITEEGVLEEELNTKQVQ